ncbi:hypothetical protein IB229_18295 [Pseudomonas sp. PDM14]|uniref:hypothetical protein n=1 Tax=Pseudomonas sp. PDM14 TaxID=2769288 RepID=UPI00177C1149|nr:hypothetical protein [Pseudomonas sp. PDM14]MBD9484938.1 hypothetical protein [Pseudomonas sp. PDM14]
MITTSDIAATALDDPANTSGVSWAAIFAGAAAAAALSLILILLGFGLGFSAVSPWSNEGISAEGLGISTIIWLAFTQLLAAGMGGYLAGRLRLKWTTLHSDEVFFRDTAHGFLAWAVATLLTATVLVGSVSGIVGAGVQASAQVASGAAPTALAGAEDEYGYYIDGLFRDDRPAPSADDAAHSVVARILARSLDNDGELAPADRAYLIQLVSQRTNLSATEAQARVDAVYAQARESVLQAKQTADEARKAAAHATLWMFVALLIGAFVGSFAATLGGRHRDTAVILVSDYRTTTAPLR